MIKTQRRRRRRSWP